MVRYRRLTIPFRLLTVLIGLTFLWETIQYIAGRIFGNSMLVEHIAAAIEYVFFSVIYFYLLNDVIIKRIIFYSIFLMIFLEILNIFWGEGMRQFPSNFLNISQVIYFVFSILFFRQMLLWPSANNILKQSRFWFNLDIMFFASSMFLNFALTNYFLKHKLNEMMLYQLSYVINMIFYVVIGGAVLMDHGEADI